MELIKPSWARLHFSLKICDGKIGVNRTAAARMPCHSGSGLNDWLGTGERNSFIDLEHHYRDLQDNATSVPPHKRRPFALAAMFLALNEVADCSPIDKDRIEERLFGCAELATNDCKRSAEARNDLGWIGIEGRRWQPQRKGGRELLHGFSGEVADCGERRLRMTRPKHRLCLRPLGEGRRIPALELGRSEVLKGHGFGPSDWFRTAKRKLAVDCESVFCHVEALIASC